MDAIRAYLLSVIGAAIISALSINFLGKNDAQSAIIKLLAGLFLSITVISPWTRIRLNNISSYFESLKVNADDVVSSGTAVADTALDQIIKERTETYILDKASSYTANINVDVTLSKSTPRTPESVVIYGTVAPYVKQQLQKVMEDDLAIPKENQYWE